MCEVLYSYVLNLPNNSEVKLYFHPHFTDVDTEAQRFLSSLLNVSERKRRVWGVWREEAQGLSSGFSRVRRSGRQGGTSQEPRSSSRWGEETRDVVSLEPSQVSVLGREGGSTMSDDADRSGGLGSENWLPDRKSDICTFTNLDLKFTSSYFECRQQISVVLSAAETLPPTKTLDVSIISTQVLFMLFSASKWHQTLPVYSGWVGWGHITTHSHQGWGQKGRWLWGICAATRTCPAKVFRGWLLLLSIVVSLEAALLLACLLSSALWAALCQAELLFPCGQSSVLPSLRKQSKVRLILPLHNLALRTSLSKMEELKAKSPF